MFNRILLLASALAAALSIAACGGGGGAAAVDATLTGAVVKGPVNNATVTVMRADTGLVLGTTTTSVNGTYSLTIRYNGDVVVEVTGGSYIDEATVASTTLGQLKAIVRPTGGTQTVVITPLTYIGYVVTVGAGGIDSTRFNTVMANLATQFGLGSTNLLTTVPSVTGTVNDYGRVLRAISQYIDNRRTGGSPTFTLENFAGGFSTMTFAAMQASFISAFNTINTGTLTFSFDGSTLTVNGSGAGGGSGSCAVTVDGSGTFTQTGIGTVPFTLPPTKICVTGVPVGTCNAGNGSLNSLAASTAVSGPGYSLSYNYAYSSDCSGASYTVALN